MTKQDAIQEISDNIDSLNRCINLIKALPDPDGFGFPVNYSASGKTVHVTIPYNIESYRVFRRAMGRSWATEKYFSTTYHADHASRCRCYWPAGQGRYGGANILLALDTKLEASTCEIRQVGVVEQPVFEVVCS